MAMDWFGLKDPFQENLPVKISNDWSGTLYFQAQLVSPPGWYSSYSGINLGNLATLTSGAKTMTWSVSVSGTALTKLSPQNDLLVLSVSAFQSGSFAAASLVDTATVQFNNALFNRYSGVIKLQGDIYNADVSGPTAAKASGGTLVSGQQYFYTMTYLQSGFESDSSLMQAGASITTSSGMFTASLTWPAPAVATVTQFFIYRTSGPNNSEFGDLIAVTSGGATSFRDNGVGTLASGIYRTIGWANTWGGSSMGNIFSSTVTLSTPSSLVANTGIGGNSNPILLARPVMLNKNLSGTLIGPFYFEWHNQSTTALPTAIYVNNTTDVAGGAGVASGEFVSGTIISDAMTTPNLSGWTRFCVYLSGFNRSGVAFIQLQTNTQLGSSPVAWFEDTFLVAQS